MKKQPVLLVAVLALVTLVACSSNKLREYDLNSSTLAARTLMPPRANVFTDLHLNIDPNHPISSALSVGSTIARESQAMEARARLDSAMAMVDVPMIVEEGVLFRAAELLDCRPINEVDESDYLFLVDIKRYGIDAQSWHAGTRFLLESRVELIDNVQKRRIWKTKLSAEEPLSPRIFGLPSTVDNVMDAVALSQLSVDEMATGLDYLAKFASDAIAEKLYRDFIKSRK